MLSGRFSGVWGMLEGAGTSVLTGSGSVVKIRPRASENEVKYESEGL